MNLSLDKEKFIKNNKKTFQMMKENSNIDDVLRLIDIEAVKKGWSRRKLAQTLNKTESWLSNIMNKKRGLSLQVLLDIAKALGINPASLLPSDENKISHISLDEYIRKIVRDEINIKSK